MTAPHNFAASVHDRLLALARVKGVDFNRLLVQYGNERLLHRLSRSPHREWFILKGATLFAVWEGEPHRATRDIDLLATHNATADAIVSAFQEIVGASVEDDGLRFDGNAVRGEPIAANEPYPGVRVRLVALLGTARIALQVDVGFGDIVAQPLEEVTLPTLLGQPAPVLRSYSREVVVAEKFEAIVHLGFVNSRLKDFFDLWVLARGFEFDGIVLARACKATFERRHTMLPMTTPNGLSDAFAADQTTRRQWQAFLDRAGITDVVPDLAVVIQQLRSFLLPLAGAAAAGTSFPYRWSPTEHAWQASG